MTTDSKITIHALASGITVAGRVLRRGQTVTLTESEVEETRDRSGYSFLEMTEADQVSRWGQAKFGHGAAPAGVEAWQDDSLARSEARDAARADALRIIDRAERIKALKAIDEKYGRPAQQWSLGTFPESR